MNSLTTLPSQHAFRASTSFSLGKKPTKKFADPGFRTYNPDIFPSLSPFSTFYNNKKLNEARACRNCSDDLEPVKKCKLEDGTSQVVSPPSGKFTPSPISPEIKATDKDCFKVPSLPKRLCDKKSLSPSAKVAPIGDLKNSAEESGTFAGKDDTMKNHQSQKSLTSSPPTEPLSEMETVQEAQDNGSLYPVIDASLLNNLYERFKLEFLLLKYSQQANNSEVKNVDFNKVDNVESNDMNMEEMIARSKDLLKEQIKKTEIDC